MSESVLVRAVRRGFYDDQIRAEESVFHIKSIADLGDWMAVVNEKDREAATREMERRKKQEEEEAAQYRSVLRLVNGVNFENDKDVQRMILKAQQEAYARGQADAIQKAEAPKSVKGKPPGAEKQTEAVNSVADVDNLV
jgi:hypothetical protein